MTIDTDPLALKRDVDRSVQQWLDREAARAAAATKAAAPQAAAAPASGPAGAMSTAAPTSEQTARRARMAAFLSIIANEGPKRAFARTTVAEQYRLDAAQERAEQEAQIEARSVAAQAQRQRLAGLQATLAAKDPPPVNQRADDP